MGKSSEATSTMVETQEKVSNAPTYSTTSTSTLSSSEVSVSVVAPTQYVECVQSYVISYADPGGPPDGFGVDSTVTQAGSADFTSTICEH